MWHITEKAHRQKMTATSFKHPETNGCANNIWERQHSHNDCTSNREFILNKSVWYLSFFRRSVTNTQSALVCSSLWSLWSCLCFCLCALVCICVRGGSTQHLWASLIKECGKAKLLFSRSNFKAWDMEGLFLGRGTCWVLHRPLLSWRLTEQLDGDAAGTICTREYCA